MNAPLAQLLRYITWANARIIDACVLLSDDQLDAKPSGGTFGSIRETLVHMVDGQRSFLARLDGRARADVEWTARPGWDEIRAVEQQTSDALIAAAEAMVEDSEVVVPFMGKRPRFPRSFFLTHAIVHGIEHRTQIGVMLTELGLTPPDLDGWQYAEAAGFGAEE